MEKAPNRAFNQEKDLVGDFPVIVKLRVIFAKVRLKLSWGEVRPIFSSDEQHRDQSDIKRRLQQSNFQ